MTTFFFWGGGGAGKYPCAIYFVFLNLGLCLTYQ